MAVLFMDGFDCYADTTELWEAGWSPHVSSTGATLSTTAGKNGGGALQCTGSLSNIGWSHAIPYGQGHDFQDNPSATMIVQFWIKVTAFAASSGSTDYFLQLQNNTRVMIRLQMRYDGTIDIDYYGGVSVNNGATSSVLFTEDTWHFCELKTVCSSAIAAFDGSFEFRIDGTDVYSASGIKMYPYPQSGSDLILQPNIIRLTNGDQTTVVYDDVVILDGTGADANLNDFTGARYIDTINVEADGGTVDWTRNTGTNDWEMVDDTANAADDDTTYVSSNTVAQEGRYNLAAPSNTDDEVHAVQIKARMKKDDAGTRTVRGVMNVAAGTEEVTFDTVGVTTEYLWHDLGVRETNDTGGTAWDVAEITNTEIGVEIVS